MIKFKKTMVVGWELAIRGMERWFYGLDKNTTVCKRIDYRRKIN